MSTEAGDVHISARASHRIYPSKLFWYQCRASCGQLKFYRAIGCNKCNKCNNNGYKGRIGLHELMIADDAAKKLIQGCAKGVELFASAVNSGKRTLKMDGMEKVLMALTDLKMVRSICIK